MVARLRAAGVVILGKTNLSEWANFRSTHSTSGWSGRGGQVRNPYALDRNPCGSSSGTGAAIAANLRRSASAPRPTDRSSVRPAPTGWSASSRRWVWSAGPASFRSPTVRTRPVRWRERSRTRRCCSTAMAGSRSGGPRDQAQPGAARGLREVPRRRRAQGRAIGVARRQYFGYSDVTDRVVEAAIADDEGARRRRSSIPANIPTAAKMDGCENEVLLYEFKAD